MPEILEELSGLISPILSQHGAYLVDLALTNDRAGKIVRISIDTDSGVGIEACAEISRAFSSELDRLDLIKGTYRLEVSSPGIDQPLRMLRQYKKNVGRRFKVIHQTEDGKTTITGRLTGVDDNRLTFETGSGESLVLDFAKILECREELPW